jgi:hypothetical protein
MLQSRRTVIYDMRLIVFFKYGAVCDMVLRNNNLYFPLVVHPDVGLLINCRVF